MIYYIWSLILSLLIFIIYNYNEYNKCMVENREYYIISINNLILFFITYLLLTIIFYYIFTSYNFNNGVSNGGNGGNGIDGDKVKIGDIDNAFLKKIPETFNTGFEPYD